MNGAWRYLIIVLVVRQTTALAGHVFCGSDGTVGGCLCVTKEGEIVFGNEEVGQKHWLAYPTDGNGTGTILTGNGDQRRYLTVDKAGKKLFLSKELEPGSYWNFQVPRGERDGTRQTTVVTKKTLEGGPFYITIDTEHPQEMNGQFTTNRSKVFTVYPVKITTKADDKRSKLTSRWFDP